MVQFTDVGRCPQTSRQTHLQVSLEVAYHRNKDEKLVDAAKDPPSSNVFEEFTGEDESYQGEQQ